MQKKASKEDLIETAVKQIIMDVHCGDSEAIEELLKFCPLQNIIEYLPEEDWKAFNHLRTEEEESREIRTENGIKTLIIRYPNDGELGKEIRKRWQNSTTL